MAGRFNGPSKAWWSLSKEFIRTGPLSPQQISQLRAQISDLEHRIAYEPSSVTKEDREELKSLRHKLQVQTGWKAATTSPNSTNLNIMETPARSQFRRRNSAVDPRFESAAERGIQLSPEEEETILQNQSPNQCWNCGEYAGPNERGTLKLVDTDPGDPEVGPDPDIFEAWHCDKCSSSEISAKIGKMKYKYAQWGLEEAVDALDELETDLPNMNPEEVEQELRLIRKRYFSDRYASRRQATYEPGRPAIFRIGSVPLSEFSDDSQEQEEIENLDGQPCVVDGVSIPSEDGDPAKEYYDISFPHGGPSLAGISGIHLEPARTAGRRTAQAKPKEGPCSQSVVLGSPTSKNDTDFTILYEADRAETVGSTTTPTSYAMEIARLIRDYPSGDPKAAYQVVMDKAKDEGISRSQIVQVGQILRHWHIPVPSVKAEPGDGRKPAGTDSTINFPQRQVVAQLKEIEQAKRGATLLLEAASKYRARKGQFAMQYAQTECTKKVAQLRRAGFQPQEIIEDIKNWSFPEPVKREAIKKLAPPPKIVLASRGPSILSNRAAQKNPKDKELSMEIHENFGGISAGAFDDKTGWIKPQGGFLGPNLEKDLAAAWGKGGFSPGESGILQDLSRIGLAKVVEEGDTLYVDGLHINNRQRADAQELAKRRGLELVISSSRQAELTPEQKIRIAALRKSYNIPTSRCIIS